MRPGFRGGAATRPLSAFLRLAMMGCPTLRARGELAAGAFAPEPPVLGEQGFCFPICVPKSLFSAVNSRTTNYQPISNKVKSFDCNLRLTSISRSRGRNAT